MPYTSPATMGASSSGAARRAAQPATVQPLSMGGQAAAGNWAAARQQYGQMPGMAGFFAQPGSSPQNPMAPRTTMHSGPGTPGMRQAYLALLSGQQSNAGNFGGAPGASLRDMRALYGNNPAITDASQMRYLPALMGLQHVYSGQGSGVW